MTASLRRAIFGECRRRGIDTETRHAIQVRATGKISLTEMDEDDMRRVLRELQGHRRPRGGRLPDNAGEPTPREILPAGPYRSKLRALWICGYELGVIRDRTDEALASWICANTDVDAAVWATPAMTAQCIEGLKDWLSRDGGVRWDPYKHGGPKIHKPRCRILEAQWMRLHRTGVLEAPDHDPLDTLQGWVNLTTGGDTSYTALKAKTLDGLIRELGKRLRVGDDSAA